MQQNRLEGINDLREDTRVKRFKIEKVLNKLITPHNNGE